MVEYMKEKIRKNKYKLIGGIVIGLLMLTFVTGYPMFRYEIIKEETDTTEEEGYWVIDWEGSVTDLAKGDYSGTGTYPLWIAGIDAATNIDTWCNTNRSHATVSGLAETHWSADADNFDEECPHSDDFNFAVKVVANDSIYVGGAWNDSRIRVTLTVSGDLDQTISAVTEYNGSATAGDLNSNGAIGSTKKYFCAYWTVGADDYDLDEGGIATISLIKVETYRTN